VNNNNNKNTYLELSIENGKHMVLEAQAISLGLMKVT
jgi:hypothetical protein